MSRTVTIHSDGTGHGTVILDEDGNKLANVTEVSVNVEANGTSTATLYVQHTSLNIKAFVSEVVFVCPTCSHSMDHTCDPTFGGASDPLPSL